MSGRCLATRLFALSHGSSYIRRKRVEVFGRQWVF